MSLSARVLLATALALPAFAGDDARDRVFSKAEILAPRSPDPDWPSKAPLELESLVPIEQSDLLVSTHRGGGAGQLNIWMKAPGGYRHLRAFTEDPGMGSYAPVTRFNYDARIFLLVPFVPLAARYAPVYTVLALEHDGTRPTLTNVEIQSPLDWFRPKLAPDESVQDDFSFTPKPGSLEWDFALYKPHDPHSTPTGGGVHGTFDLCQEQRYDDATRRWTSTWRMFVHDGERVPMAAPGSTPWGNILPMCPAPAVAGYLLPQPAPAEAP